MNPLAIVPLDRQFRPLPQDVDKPDDYERLVGLGLEKPEGWDSLLPLYRVVILAEAGAGKTLEIRSTAQRLRAEGKKAFFLRLEFIRDQFDAAFEEGTLEEFQAWLASDEEAWVFLDSVDEARLADPKQFEAAIRVFAQRTKSAHTRLHAYITSRPHAWRPRTDLALVEAQLPLPATEQSALVPILDPENSPSAATKTQDDDEGRAPKIFALAPLDTSQIRAFAAHRGVPDTEAFIEAIARQNAWLLATRPFDLDYLIAYWLEHGEIGSRLQLLQSGIDRRLEERDEDRSQSQPLDKDKGRFGARLLASAATLMKLPAIRVPDGLNNAVGINASTVLSDWPPSEIQALLSRPVFDEAIFGAVRFRHREVRELLTAEWVAAMLKRGAPRGPVEALLFREEYGEHVIIPTFRPILSWLILFDDAIRDRVLALAPEIALEGGDPSQLPLPVRRAILSEVTAGIVSQRSERSAQDHEAITRFAQADLAEDVDNLIATNWHSDDALWFLARLVWQGAMRPCLPRMVALVGDHNKGVYARIAAIRALCAIGSAEEIRDAWRQFIVAPAPIDRRLLAEFLANLPTPSISVEEVVRAVEHAEEYQRFHSTGLSQAIHDLIRRLAAPNLTTLIAGLNDLLDREPVIERRHCEVSQKFAWLLPCAAHAVERLIKDRDRAALAPAAISILLKMPLAKAYGDVDFDEVKVELPKLVPEWPDLNYVLFWSNVEATRRAITKKGERLTDFWPVAVFGEYWAFTALDFERVVGDIETKPFLDDRLVALTLAFRIYRDNGRPRRWRECLKKIAAREPELEAALQLMLHPPKSTAATWKAREREWEKRRRDRDQKKAEQWADFVGRVRQDPEALRNNIFGHQGTISGWQAELHRYLRDKLEGRSHWSIRNWRDLVPEFGEEVATAFRDGALRHWREYSPELRSQSDAGSSLVPYAVIFGLSGLEIEAQEDNDWPAKLSAAEVEVAARYVFRELNGFPAWFQRFYEAHPDHVRNAILTELFWELEQATAEGNLHYVLHDLVYYAPWLHPVLAEPLLAWLEANEPKNFDSLRYCLAIVVGADIDGQRLANVAAAKARSGGPNIHLPMWYAIWVDNDPDAAIPALSTHLSKMEDQSEASQFAQQFVVSLVGGRRTAGRSRGTFKTSERLKSLYLLMLGWVRKQDDIDRSGGGVYSPGLRDDAQDARNQLFSLLTNIPGKETYLALKALAAEHPEPSSRPWMAVQAKRRAEEDADLQAWSAEQVRDFDARQELTPSNHQQLFDLAVARFSDLKADLERGDTSIASLLTKAGGETELRNYLCGWCRDRAAGRYAVPQEEEFADAKRPDMRFYGMGFDGPVPIEVKLADNWSGAQLCERLENQLCGDYLRDNRSTCGIFLLLYRGEKNEWKLPNGHGGTERVDFAALVLALQSHWERIAPRFPKAEQIWVVGIDLTMRAISSRDQQKLL
jgi:hypothetical protein